MTLEARNLFCRRGTRPVFAPVSFRLNRGQALLLQGPNGAGKTTLLRALAGLGPAPEGEVLFDGGTVPEGWVAMTAHLDAVKPALSVAENLGFWARLHGRDDAVGAALDALDLARLAGRLAGRLSAGQRRRLGLARLAVSSAPVWLCDEPTVSLDAESTAAFGRMVERHLDGGGLAVIATHLPLPLDARQLALRPPSAADHPDSTSEDPFLAEAYP